MTDIITLKEYLLCVFVVILFIIAVCRMSEIPWKSKAFFWPVVSAFLWPIALPLLIIFGPYIIRFNRKAALKKAGLTSEGFPEDVANV